MKTSNVISIEYDILDTNYRQECKRNLDEHGVIALPNFISAHALKAIKQEAKAGKEEAYFCVSKHGVYLTPQDKSFANDHPKNIQVTSSKGCICDDVINANSPLRQLYDDEAFKAFICELVSEQELHPYADPLSSINIHYAGEGQELGWHFDNSSFAITLLIDKPDGGGEFEYVKDLRNADAGDMNFDGVSKVLSKDIKPDVLQMDAGTLVLFRGRNSMHRVTPTIGSKTRMLAVLAYNNKAGVELSQSARMTFYGRLD